MDKKAPDFGQDLSSLSSNVALEVADVLDALRKKKEGAKPAAAAAARQPEPVETEKRAGPQGESAQEPIGQDTVAQAEIAASDPSAATPRKQRSASRQRTRASEEEEVVLQNVTTRLRRDTNELLTEAALRQKLKKTGPDSRQDIIEAALHLWFREEGYAKA
jgi:hypothetical protein